MPAIPRSTNPSAVPGFRKRPAGSAGSSSSSGFTPSTETGIYLSDGDAELNLIGTPPDGIWLQPKGFTWPIPEMENVYAQSDTSEYRSRIRTRPLNPDGKEVKLFVGANTERDFWNYVDVLQEFVASVHRKKGTLRVVPPRNGQEVTWDIESIRVRDIPDDGVELNQLLVEVTLEYECRPYGKLDSVDLWTDVALVGPVTGQVVSGVPGHMDALGELTVLNNSSSPIGHLEVGLEPDVDPDHPTPLIIGVDGMKLGYQGTRTTLNGYYADGVRATITDTPSIICSTGPQPHKGRWRVRARLKPSGQPVTTFVRLSWRVGAGIFTAEPWVALPAASEWYDPTVAMLNIPEVASGEHSWEGQLEAYVSASSVALDVDYFGFMPSETWTCARAPLPEPEPATFSLFDNFSAISGAITGDSSTSGHTWASMGGHVDAGDFSAGTDSVVRTDTGDTGLGVAYGRGVLLGTRTYSDVCTGVSVQTSLGTESHFLGVISRFTDNDNFSFAAYNPLLSFGYGISGSAVIVYKVIGGTQTYVDAALVPGGPTIVRKLQFLQLSNGTYGVYVNGRRALAGRNSSFASDGELPSGKSGLLDYKSLATAATREYTGFRVSEPTAQAACHVNRTALIRHNAALCESANGTSYGQVPVPAGKYLTLPPATGSDRKSRLVIKARKYDVDDGLPDAGLDLTLSADLAATGRVTALSKQIA